ncbi:hypothetical protein AB6A40_007973 [Gnathostoma spinigerum]|uniref:Diphthine--ammonia ligase n=1 Tax=Gnathostoma spinigerum TaxID=75299 RepID=A0ABD6ESW8_9BILA
MKVVGLVSGGKDSCFNLMKCVENDHEIVCLANLYPPHSADADEIDSYMYQSVGHSGLEIYGEAFGLPIYRKEINGKPITTSAEYEPTFGDEVEDLFQLLSVVKERHPDIEGSISQPLFGSDLFYLR